MIRIEQLKVGYHSALLSFPSIELKQGEMYALIGRNGIGKSTFLKTITGQLAPMEGIVFMNNSDIATIPFNALPRFVSYVNARFPLVDFLSVHSFIALGRSPYTNLLGKLSSDDLDIISSVIEQLNIAHLKDRFTSELSDGERQLVAIAKAVVQQTDIIVLDEPTAFLDYANKEEVLNQLTSIAKTMNKCVIVATHDIDLVVNKGIQFLLIDETLKTGNIYDASTTKADILATCFKSMHV